MMEYSLNWLVLCVYKDRCSRCVKICDGCSAVGDWNTGRETEKACWEVGLCRRIMTRP